MIRALSKWAAKQYYIAGQEFQAGIADLHAGLSLRLAGEKRVLIEKLNKEADDIEANIKKVDEQLAAGYWECENGHEHPDNTKDSILPTSGVLCGECDYKVPMKLVRTDLMTGQEKYESDKERKDAEDMAAAKRATVKAEEENAAGSEKAAKYFQDQVKSFRTIAEKLRSL
jgi:L-lactate utilization protein LutB